MHRVAVVAFDGVVPFDLATPCEVFTRVRLKDGTAPYDVRICGVRSEIDAGLFEMRVRYGLRTLAQANTVIVPGVADPTRPLPDALLRALRRAAAKGTRIASVCSGAFVLAAAGLLDGKRATTHWLGTAALSQQYPRIEVDPNVLYVDNGQVLTSAGAAAGLDLCLHLVRRDFGAGVAAEAARFSVMPLERHGGQAQFIAHKTPSSEGAPLDALLIWIGANLTGRLSLPRLARQAGMSERTLARRFAEQLGMPPAQWIVHARVRRAQLLLEKTRLSIDGLADKVGFGSVATFRERFRAIVGTSPSAYRASFGSRRATFRHGPPITD